MRIAFYAPLKPPDHPVASGDRRMAQLFLAALRLAGHEPVLASHLRSFDATGDRRRQARLAQLGARLAGRYLARHAAAPPQLWFTYHLYHKAPDWLGPQIAEALAIPYVVAEASFAPKRAGGPWAAGHCAVAAALRRADAVIGLNPADRPEVLPLLRAPERWIAMKPFLDAALSPPTRPAAPGPVRLIAVAMMREGDKLASYRLLSAALRQLLDLPWSLEVVGDGPARAAVAETLAPLGARVFFAGALAAPEVATRLAAADLFVWPAVNEAIGMALLEAQAAGLPVVAGAAGGVGEVVADGESGYLVPPNQPRAFADALRALILDSPRRAAFAAAARRRVREEHDLPVAARQLAAVIDRLVPGGARRPTRCHNFASGPVDYMIRS